ncbi:MAG: endonuclease/exonuclease/phosphatase [Bacteroidetes bacterium]|jgi:hypothetical protein|nr:endonuclease/exonuclease/phosphatase [Bacteroidota bacterium]
MKKSILLSAALLIGAGAIAQTQYQTNTNKKYKLNKGAKIEAQNFQFNTNLQPKASNHNSVATAPPYVKFSSQRNAFGFIESTQNCLSYNQDLNCVALFQRMTQDWPGNAFTPTVNPATSTSFSGYQVVKFTTDNGASWDSVAYYQNATNWGRYPSGVIYNTAGNTDISNARFVGTGPTVNGSTWMGNWFASVQPPTGAMPRTVQNNDQQSPLATAAGSASLRTYFSCYSTCVGGSGANMKVYTGGFKASDPGAPAGTYGVAIFKGTYNGTNAFTWEQDSSLANMFTISDGESDNQTPHIAFGPDGMTGYILVDGSDVNATLPLSKQSYQPMVWKTIDGGVTWNRVNQNYDWVANNPEIFGNLRETSPGSGVALPAFFDLWGGGIAVDANGKLHYATAACSAGSTNPDSLGFYTKFAYPQFGCDDRPWVFDFMTDGNGTWTTAKVTDLFTSDLGRTTAADTNAAMNIWSNVAERFDYDNRIRISRSADGTKMFYSWTDGDTNSVISVYNEASGTFYDAYRPNDYPWISYRGMDVNTGMFTPIHTNSGANSNSGGYFFYYPTDIAMTTPGGYTLPMTYLDSRAGLYDATAAVDVYYIDDNTIASTEFTEPAYPVCPLSIGIKEVAGTTVSNVSQSFPNPTSATSIVKVNLNKSEDITLNVTNSIGQVVATQTVKGTVGENQLTIDATSLNSGIYFYTVISGNSKVTRKMSVTK